MRRFVLDTSICLAFVRGQEIFKKIENELNLISQDSISIISIVTKAELLSLGKRNGWGDKKLNTLKKLLEKLFIIDINNSDEKLIEAYYMIGAFSQGKLGEKPLNDSAKNMGKNDLWIAATTCVTQAELITMDGDFDHLGDIKVHKYD